MLTMTKTMLDKDVKKEGAATDSLTFFLGRVKGLLLVNKIDVVLYIQKATNGNREYIQACLQMAFEFYKTKNNVEAVTLCAAFYDDMSDSERARFADILDNCQTSPQVAKQIIYLGLIPKVLSHLPSLEAHRMSETTEDFSLKVTDEMLKQHGNVLFNLACVVEQVNKNQAMKLFSWLQNARPYEKKYIEKALLSAFKLDSAETETKNEEDPTTTITYPPEEKAPPVLVLPHFLHAHAKALPVIENKPPTSFKTFLDCARQILAEEKNSQTLHQLGRQAYELGHYNLAIKTFSTLCKMNKNDVIAKYNRGCAYHATHLPENYPRALQSYNQVLILQPNHIDARSRRKEIYAALGKTEPKQSFFWNKRKRLYALAPSESKRTFQPTR